MNEKIMDVLAPYEDEVLVSWIVRMLRMYTGGKLNDTSAEVMRILFGSSTTRLPGLYFQKGLHYFSEHCGCKDKMVFYSERTMLKQMTVLPFYMSFIQEWDYKKIEYKIENTPFYIHVEKVLGLRNRRKYIEENAYFKFCEKCLMEQSEIYLHTEHQIQGNYICWKHGCVLHRIPYRLFWKDIDFIDKIEKHKEISQFEIPEFEMETANKISLLIHKIFEQGFHDENETLKLKIMQKLFDEGIVNSKGNFFDLDFFVESLNVSYLYKHADLKSVVLRALVKDSTIFHVNPIIYLVLIIGVFGTLEEYFEYELRTAEQYLVPISKVRYYQTEKEIHDIDYYSEAMDESFWKEYIVLGDTEESIIIKHLVCGRNYSVLKNNVKLRKCRECKVGNCSSINRNLYDGYQKIQYCRYINAVKYGQKHHRKVKQIRNYCNDNRIPGAIRLGNDIYIPEDAPYPKDRRFK